MSRELTAIDQLMIGIQSLLSSVCVGGQSAERQSPADGMAEPTLTDEQRRISQGLMRINHTGEVCAQALYRGQSLVAKDPAVRDFLHHAEYEEKDHLAWCQQRLNALGTRPSIFNIYWYCHSFTLGVLAGCLSDEWSLGFVNATEEQVESHLQTHLQRLPATDKPSRAIVTQMMQDEQAHANAAMKLGGKRLPSAVQQIMRAHAAIMKWVVYRL